MSSQNQPVLDHSAAPASGYGALWPWYVALVLGSYAVTLLTDGVYFYAHDVIGARPEHSLWLSAFWGLCYVPISLLAGRWVDRFGPRRMARIMALGVVAASLLVWGVELAPSVVLLGALLVAYNFTTSSIWPAIETAVTRTPSRMTLDNKLALYNIGWASTNCVALVTAGSWAAMSWSAIFVVPAVTSTLVLIVLMLARKPPAQGGHAEVAPEMATAGRVVMDPRKLLYMAWIGNAMCYVAINVLLPVLPQLTISSGFTDLRVKTAAGAVWTFTRFAGFVALWFWTRWHYRPGLLIAGQAILLVSFLGTMALPVSGLPEGVRMGAFLGFQAVFGFCTAFIYASSLYYAMHVSSGAGGHAGIHEALIGIGVAVGPTFGALCGHGEGAAAIPGVTAAVSTILTVGVVAMIVLAKKAKKVAT